MVKNERMEKEANLNDEQSKSAIFFHDKTSRNHQIAKQAIIDDKALSQINSMIIIK